MPPSLSLLVIFTAAVTILIAAGLLAITRKTQRVGLGRVARNHLTEFSRAWGLLAGYYILRIALPLMHYPADTLNTAYDSTSPFWSFIYHMVVLTFCTATNFYLRRAILELEVFYKEPGLETIDIRRMRLLKHITDEGILASFILGNFFLLIPIIVDPGDYSKGFILTAYTVQLLVSSALFFRLAIAYRHYRGGQLPFIASAIYSSLQLLYPVHFLTKLPAYEYVLTFSKMSLAVSVGAFALNVVRIGQKHEGKNFLLLDFKERSDSAPNSLDRLAARSETQARLRTMFQLCVAIVALLLISASIWRPYALSIAFAKDKHLSPAVILAFRLAWLVPSLLLIQAVTYFSILRLNFRVNWKEHAQGALFDLITVDVTGKQYYPKWNKTTIGRKAVPSSSTTGPLVQVVLLHGIFSSGTSCWGLLPAILLESGLVSRVHLLSYRHNIWSSKKRLYGISEDLVTILEGVVNPSQEATIVFAHSLGGLLMMRALTWMINNNKHEALEKIKHLVCVATPLTGSKYAALGWPWAWPRSLSRGSKFITSTLESFTNKYVPAGYITGEEKPLCSCSFFYGTQDDVAGSDVKILGLTGKRVSIPTWHSAGAVYFKSSPLTPIYIEELSPASRSVQLMKIIVLNLIGKRPVRFAAIFQLDISGEIGTAKIWETLTAGWDEFTQNSGNRNERGQPLAALLEKIFVASEEPSANEWERYWSHLRAVVRVAHQYRELVVMEWPDESTLYLFSNQEAGLAFIARENYRVSDD